MLISLAMLSAVSVIEQMTSKSLESSRQQYKISLFNKLLNSIKYDKITKANLGFSFPIEIDPVVTINEINSVQYKSNQIATLIEAKTTNGYNGAITVMMAINPGGHIIGIQIMEHKETPGLGDRIEWHRSQWLQQFINQSLNQTPKHLWKVRKDRGQFDQLTGATITSRAVANLFLGALEFHKQRLRTLQVNKD